MLRVTLTSILIVAFTISASAYSGCEKYRFGSDQWWFCVSDKDGER
jgi:hypothetical protein